MESGRAPPVGPKTCQLFDCFTLGSLLVFLTASGSFLNNGRRLPETGSLFDGLFRVLRGGVESLKSWQVFGRFPARFRAILWWCFLGLQGADPPPESRRNPGAGPIRISEKLAKFWEVPSGRRLLVLNISQCALDGDEFSRKCRSFCMNLNVESRWF